MKKTWGSPLRCFPEDERFFHESWLWHLSGRPAQRLAKVPGFRWWWRWWTKRWLGAIVAASKAKRTP